MVVEGCQGDGAGFVCELLFDPLAEGLVDGVAAAFVFALFVSESLKALLFVGVVPSLEGAYAVVASGEVWPWAR